MEHVWTAAAGGRAIVLNGNGNRAVFTSKAAKGYLWVYEKQAAHAPTIELAKDWVETLAELRGTGIGAKAAVASQTCRSEKAELRDHRKRGVQQHPRGTYAP